MRASRIQAITCIVFGFAAAFAPANPADVFFEAHCTKCHDEAKSKGDLRLDNLKPDFDQRATLTIWQHVLEKIENGEMPPKSKPRPPEKELRSAADWIADKGKIASAKLREAEGRVVMRRLNRNDCFSPTTLPTSRDTARRATIARTCTTWP